MVLNDSFHTHSQSCLIIEKHNHFLKLSIILKISSLSTSNHQGVMGQSLIRPKLINA